MCCVLLLVVSIIGNNCYCSKRGSSSSVSGQTTMLAPEMICSLVVESVPPDSVDIHQEKDMFDAQIKQAKKNKKKGITFLKKKKKGYWSFFLGSFGIDRRGPLLLDYEKKRKINSILSKRFVFYCFG